MSTTPRVTESDNTVVPSGTGSGRGQMHCHFVCTWRRTCHGSASSTIHDSKASRSDLAALRAGSSAKPPLCGARCAQRVVKHTRPSVATDVCGKHWSRHGMAKRLLHPSWMYVEYTSKWQPVNFCKYRSHRSELWPIHFDGTPWNPDNNNKVCNEVQSQKQRWLPSRGRRKITTFIAYLAAESVARTCTVAKRCLVMRSSSEQH